MGFVALITMTGVELITFFAVLDSLDLGDDGPTWAILLAELSWVLSLEVEVAEVLTPVTAI